IPAPHRRPADLFDPALHPRRKKLSHHRLWLHRRQTPIRHARRVREKIPRKARLLRQSHPPRYREVKAAMAETPQRLDVRACTSAYVVLGVIFGFIFVFGIWQATVPGGDWR